MKNTKKKEALVKVLSVATNSSWYDLIKEIKFLERQESFGCASGKYQVSGGISIICNDFGVKTPESWDVTEKGALQCLLKEVEDRTGDRISNVYGDGCSSQVRWSQGRYVDFRNTISKILEIFGEAEDSVDLDSSQREKIYLLLLETPAHREHYYYYG